MKKVIPIGIGIVGCGFVSDFYLNTMSRYSEMRPIAVFDRNLERAVRLGDRYDLQVETTLQRLINRDDISFVVNLTNPASHVEVTAAALKAGKHVYSEKPLASTLDEGLELVDLANRKELLLACAPANILGESLQTVWSQIRAGAIGEPRLAYAQLDDGAVHRMDYKNWVSGTGVEWPYRDEFATGCTVEHAGYHLQPLTSMFGPVRRVVSDVATLIQDKLPEGESGLIGPDYTVASFSFASGVVARLTCSIVAPVDHSLLIIGDEGTLRIDDCWDFGSPVTLQKVVGRNRYLSEPVPIPLVRPYSHQGRYESDHQMEFPRGIADTVQALASGVLPRLSAEQALHVLDIESAISAGPGTAEIASDFPRPEPMPWAG